MNPNEKTNQGVQFSFRLEKELSDRIAARADDEGVKPSAWVRKALAFALENMIEEKETVNKSALVEMLENDTDFQDILFEKMAQKLRLDDVKNYLAEFALYGSCRTAEELCKYLQGMSARLFHLLPAAINDDGFVSFKKIECTLQWNKMFTWKEFLQLTPGERRAFDFFYLEMNGPAGSGFVGGTGLYFWSADENITETYPEEYFDDSGADVVVHACLLLTNERKMSYNIRNRIVKAVRYAAREADLGDYGNLYDETLTGYYITNRGYFPAALPLEFGFFWVSENMRYGLYTYEEFLQAVKDKTDKTLRPVVSPRWHYTNSELKRFSEDEELPPFTETATAAYIAKGYYNTRIYSRTGRVHKMDYVCEVDGADAGDVTETDTDKDTGKDTDKKTE